MLPGNYNKACSAYFGGHYHGLYSGSSSSEEDHDDPATPSRHFTDQRFTTRKAMTFLRRSRGQAFLAQRKLGEWSFPCEVTEVIPGTGMVVKQYIPEGGEDDFVEPEFKDCLIPVTLEPEILEFVYLYRHTTPNGVAEWG
jgi:hypothetical protein